MLECLGNDFIEDLVSMFPGVAEIEAVYRTHHFKVFNTKIKPHARHVNTPRKNGLIRHSPLGGL